MSTVTLNVTVKNGSLDVDEEGGPNRIPHGDIDTIVLQLTGNAASGQFNAMNASHPGFKWISTTPEGVFGPATLQANGKQIQFSDNNTDPNGVHSAGTWVYQIYAMVNGQECGTTYTTPIGVINNPTIQNM